MKAITVDPHIPKPYLPTREEAQSMHFSDLAKVLRLFVEESKKQGIIPSALSEASELVKILSGCIPVEQPPPEPAPLEPLEPPSKPLRPPPLICNNSEYKRVKSEHNAKIAELNGKLRRSSKWTQKVIKREVKDLTKQRDQALTYIALSEHPTPFAEKWLAQKRAYDEFEREVAIFGKRGAIYEQRRKAHLADFGQWQAKYDNQRNEYNTYQRIADHLKNDIQHLISGDLQPRVEKLWWRFLPPGEDGINVLANAIENLHKKDPELRIDEARIHFAQALKPSHIFVGEDEFQGYFAFVFEQTQRVLLDNPIEGNAAYVFFKDWKELSRFPKFYLLRNYPHKVERVIHRESGQWKSELRRLLRL